MTKRLVVYKKICNIKDIGTSKCSCSIENRKENFRSRHVFRSFDKRTPLGRKAKGLTNAGLRQLLSNSSQNSTETQQKWCYFYKRRKNTCGKFVAWRSVFLFHAEYAKNINSV